MKRILFFAVLFTFPFCALAQESSSHSQNSKIVNHTVQQNETVLQISKKYEVDPAEIYRINRHALYGINEGMVLHIPVASDFSLQTTTQNTPITINDTIAVVKDTAITGSTVAITETKHKVLAGETLSGLARKYGTTITVIKESNEKLLSKGLQIGQEIIIPLQKTADTPLTPIVEKSLPETGGIIRHKVTAGETLSGLARKYNTAIDVIQSNNVKLLQKGLQTGQILAIPVNQAVKSEVVKPPMTQEVTIRHQVVAKETLYGLSRKYGVSVEVIKEQNEALLKNGLQAGQVLLIKVVHTN